MGKNITSDEYLAMQERINKSRYIELVPKRAEPVKRGRKTRETNTELIIKEKQTKRKNHLEDDLQEKIVKFVRTNYLNTLIFSIPNGGRRNMFEAVRLKKQGVLAGVADLQIISYNKIIFVEVKIEGGKQSENQKAFQEAVEQLGFQYSIIYSVDDVIKLLD